MSTWIKGLQVNVFLFKFTEDESGVTHGLTLTGWNWLYFTFTANSDISNARWLIWQFSNLQKKKKSSSEWRRNTLFYYIIFSHWVFFFFPLRCCVLAIWLPLTSFGSVIEANKIDRLLKRPLFLARYWISKTFILMFLILLLSFVGKKKRGWNLLHVNLSVFIYYERNFQNFTVWDPESLFKKWSHTETRLAKLLTSQI